MKNEKGFFRSTYLFNNAAYFLFTLCFTGLNSLDATSQSYALHNNAWAEIESDEKKEDVQIWNVDKVHSKVGFTITHLVISEIEGKFSVYEGTINSETSDFEGASISFSVDVSSINTDNSMRDDHLKSDDFFNAEKFPRMKFESYSFSKKEKGKYRLKGNLTIRDVTKEVEFDVKFGGIAPNDGYGNTKAGFKATTTINRFDYGLKWNSLTEAGGLTVGEEVDITMNLQFAKKK